MSILFDLLYDSFLVFQLVIFLFLVQPFILLTIYLFRNIFRPASTAKVITASRKQFSFGVIVTAHQDTRFLLPIVDSLIRQTYPKFNVYVVCDDCDRNNLPVFEDQRIHCLRPPEALNTNTKSIDYALNHFNGEEVMVIFDPDNLVHPRFLEVLNNYYNRGYEAVQGNLNSKKIENLYEKLDSIGNTFNTFIDRDVRSELNLSVNIWGCGISVKTEIYRNIKYDDRVLNGGFDKFLQLEIAKQVQCLAYAREAIFYDEKIKNGSGLEKQRIRWIRSYFKFLPDAFKVFISGVRHWKFNQAYYGLNYMKPPYFLQLLLGLIFLLVDAFINRQLFVDCTIVLTVFLISLISIVSIKNTDRSVRKVLWFMPLFFFHQIRSFFKLRMNKQYILKTENTKVLYIEDILKNEVC